MDRSLNAAGNSSFMNAGMNVLGFNNPPTKSPVYGTRDATPKIN